MAVFVEAGRGQRERDPGKSISGAVRGTPGRRYRPGWRGKRLREDSFGLIQCLTGGEYSFLEVMN